jgi:hypothetical protein
MKKVPSENIMKLHKDLLVALEKDIYRDNPSKDILNKRKAKQKRLQKQFDDLENKYEFDTSKHQYINKAEWIEEFTLLKDQKEKIEHEDFSYKINFTDTELRRLYHTIETEKLNAADMYSVVKALQLNLQRHKEYKCSKKKDNTIKTFNERGGIQRYNQLKNYLTDIGVNVYEIN